MAAKEAPRMKFNPDPQLACEVVYVTAPDGKQIGVIKSWMAFDPQYGPESESQIEYFKKAGYDTRHWEVGKPVKIKMAQPQAA